MRQAQTEIQITTRGKGLVDISDQVIAWVESSTLTTGLLTVFIRHTSASLVVQENADPDVLTDLNRFFEQLAPEDPNLYRHRAEGPDDMPAHIKSALTSVSLSIPVASARPVLGTWQGIYLFEHRSRPHVRAVCLHMFGT